jgi:hypothetical protein
MKKLSLALIVLSLLASQSVFAALVVTETNDPTTLANTILGPGITLVGTPTYEGAAVASGTFAGGNSVGIGFDQGIILTSGQASLAPGPNNNDSAGLSNGAAGSALLNTLIPGFSTQNATLLTLNFKTGGGDLFFKYVFASEEYNEFTNSSFNDVFGFFLADTNIALIPGTTTPVAINNVNRGSPRGTSASNSALFNNNDVSDGVPFFNIQYDGFTDVFTAQALGLGEGEYQIILAIADAGDAILDSAVFIQAGSFSDKPIDPVPEPATMILLGAGLAGLAGFGRKKFKK